MKQNRFYSSDHHFDHNNIMKYEPVYRTRNGKPFNDVHDMNYYMVEQWNAVVQPNDLVFYLGDFSFKNHSNAKFLQKLNGRKILIVGNHDPIFHAVWDNNSHDKVKEFKDYGWDEVHPFLFTEIEGIGKVQLSHFPYSPKDTAKADHHDLRYMKQRPTQQDEKLLIHGHVHSKWTVNNEHTADGYPQINVGVETNDLMPVSEERIIELYKSLLG